MWSIDFDLDNLIISNKCGLELVIENYRSLQWEQKQLPTDDVIVRSLQTNKLELVSVDCKQFTLHYNTSGFYDISWELPAEFGEELWNIFSENIIVDKPSCNIEYIQGQESHSSYWGKFYVKGLEDLVCKEDHEFNRSDKHHSYQYYYGTLDTSHNNLFTVFVQEGNKHGTDKFEFYICQLDVYSHNIISGENRNSGFIEGNFKIIAEGIGKTKAPRLMGWWVDNPQLQSLDYAIRCAESIKKRGVTTP